MRLEIIRQLPSDDKVELLVEVDNELLEVYRSETGADDFDQDSFDSWLNSLIDYSLESGDYGYEE